MCQRVIVLLSLLLVTSIAAAVPPTSQSTSRPTTSGDDPFVKRVRDAVDVKAGRLGPLQGVARWDDLLTEADKADRLGDRERRRAYVELWRQLVQMHDFGLECSKMNVFEDKVRVWLGPKGKVRVHRDETLVRPMDADSVCRYLLVEDLPAWARSLRMCAAASLAGRGDPEGMAILKAAIRRSADGGVPRFDVPLYEVEEMATTEAATALWLELLNDANPTVRKHAIQQVGPLRSPRIVEALVAMLTDKDSEIRVQAATQLLGRGRADGAALLLEHLRDRLADKPATSYEAGLCVQLAALKVKDVPWEKVEAALAGGPTRDNFWIANACLEAGRETAAAKFLDGIIAGADGAAMNEQQCEAARILARGGRAEGVTLLADLLKKGQSKSWVPADQALTALADYCNHPKVTAAQRAAIIAAAAVVLDRQAELFHGYFSKAIEQLGRMGAVMRLDEKDNLGRIVEPIPLYYDRGYGNFGAYMIEAIFNARMTSLEVAARQDGVKLSADWLKEQRQKQIVAVEALTGSKDAKLADAARRALKSNFGQGGDDGEN